MRAPYRAWPRATLAGLLVAPVLLAGPAATGATSQDVRRQLDQLTTRIEAGRARQAELADAERKLQREVDAAQQEVTTVTARLQGRIRATYTAGLGSDTMVVMLTSPDPSRVLDRLALLEAAQSDDRAALTRSRAARRILASRQARLRALRRDATLLDRRMAADAAVMRALFTRISADESAAAARAAEKARLAKARRLAAARRPRADRVSRDRSSRSASVSGNLSCLVGPVNSYADTWGAPRSGGRRHKGTDVFAPYGSPAYAVTDGVVTRTGSGGLGGIVLYLRGDNGDEYYYAHNSANLARPGDRVAAGEQIARVGDSGNAQGGSPHIHFEVHPGGGAPVNPYPFVRRTCG